MPTRRTLCVFPDGTSFWATPEVCEEILKYEEGRRDGERIAMKEPGNGRGPRSSRVGHYLAQAVRRGEPWARTMVREVLR